MFSLNRIREQEGGIGSAGKGRGVAQTMYRHVSEYKNNKNMKPQKHGCAGAFCNNLSHIPLGISLGVVLLDHMADLCSVFK
jgi:hypothetical protein